MFEIATSEVSNIVVSVIASAAGFSLSRTIFARRQAEEARALSNNDAFESALGTADLDSLGAMLRNRFGVVTLEALLNDQQTQEQVSRSLKRLTEVVNQPAPEAGAEPNTTLEAEENLPEAEPPSHQFVSSKHGAAETYVDTLPAPLRANLGAKIMAIAETGDLRVHGTNVWNALADARRQLEREILPQVSGSRRFLSPRIFRDPQLRNAMGAFLSVANRAIHGEDTSFERAERAMAALQFVGNRLASESFDGDEQSETRN